MLILLYVGFKGQHLQYVNKKIKVYYKMFETAAKKGSAVSGKACF